MEVDAILYYTTSKSNLVVAREVNLTRERAARGPLMAKAKFEVTWVVVVGVVPMLRATMTPW